MCAKGVRVFFEGFGEESLASNCFALLVWKVRLWLGRRENSGETQDCFTSNTGFSGEVSRPQMGRSNFLAQSEFQSFLGFHSAVKTVNGRCRAAAPGQCG